MTNTEQALTALIEDGQSGKYKEFIRNYTGAVRLVMELKNPLSGDILIGEIVKLIEIVNPELKEEIEWFNKLQNALKLWVNEKVVTNRLLGLRNDNDYDMEVFEKVVKEKFWLPFKEKIKPDAIVETSFKSMVELVEMGARRFGRY